MNILLLVSEKQWDFYEEIYAQTDYQGRVTFPFQVPILEMGYESLPFKGFNIVNKKFEISGYRMVDLRGIGNDLSKWRKELYKEMRLD